MIRKFWYERINFAEYSEVIPLSRGVRGVLNPVMYKPILKLLFTAN
jgi:hypothetical protein